MSRRHARASRAAHVPLLGWPQETRPNSELVQDDDAQHLENLRVALRIQSSSLYTQLVRPAGGRPFLVVKNLMVEQFSEHITLTAEPGTRHYRWSWEQPISPVTDPASAARQVAKVLEASAEADGLTPYTADHAQYRR